MATETANFRSGDAPDVTPRAPGAPVSSGGSGANLQTNSVAANTSRTRSTCRRTPSLA